MRYWYEADDGFMNVTGIPYKELECKNCHAKNCDACHVEETDAGMIFSVEKAQKMETCTPCHSREGLSIKLDDSAGTPDVHFNMGFDCSTCHKGNDVHGTGTLPKSMRDPGFLQTKCYNCHTKGGMAPYDPSSRPHTVHGEKLD